MAIAEKHTSVCSLAGTSGNPGTGVRGNLEPHMGPTFTLISAELSYQWVLFL